MDVWQLMSFMFCQSGFLKRYPWDNLTTHSVIDWGVELITRGYYKWSFPILRCHIELKNVNIGFDCIFCVWSILNGACLTSEHNIQGLLSRNCGCRPFPSTTFSVHSAFASSSLWVVSPSPATPMLPGWWHFTNFNVLCTKWCLDFMRCREVWFHRFYHALPWILRLTCFEVCLQKTPQVRNT